MSRAVRSAITVSLPRLLANSELLKILCRSFIFIPIQNKHPDLGAHGVAVFSPEALVAVRQSCHPAR